ncbi:MAG: hypothetical protein EPO67_07380, partial [Reyranella sp.]
MRRLLKFRTWTLRGTTAAEASLVLMAASVALPVLLFAGASWLSYGDTEREYRERVTRTLDLLYVGARATFETQQLVMSNVAGMIDGFS